MESIENFFNNKSLKIVPMFRLIYMWFIFHYVIRISDSQLRIRDGLDLPDTTGDKPYMVYLTLSPSAKVYYDAWICGGAIVSKYYIVTSAACVQDAVYMYAIAGYKHYVRFDQIATDSCTSHVRKKVVEYCIPKSYDFSYTELDKWAHIDIALAKVESSFNLASTDPEQGCTYPPRKIEISFYKRWQEPGVDAFVLGWGHNKNMRQPEDPLDYNAKELKYATAHIVNKNECKTAYKKARIVASSRTFDSTIDKYMICTKGKGNFDFKGTMIDKSFVNVDGCQEFGPNRRLRAECLQINLNRTNVDTPAKPQSSEQPSLDSILRSSYKLDYSDLTRRVDEDLRVPGICQNDHGGPLVTWVGAKEYLIGVASVFMIVGHDEECRGPFLFTSTHCNSHFLGCKLRNELKDLRFVKMVAKSSVMRESIVQTTTNRTLDQQPIHENQGGSKEDINFSNLRRQFDFEAFCNKPAKERGYELIDKKISWRNHPDGPSAIELEEDRLKALKEPLNENPYTNPFSNPMDNQKHSLNDTQNHNINLNVNPNKLPNGSLNVNPINNQYYKLYENLNFNLNENSNNYSKNSQQKIYTANYDNFTYNLNENLTYNLKDDINNNPDVNPIYNPSDNPNYNPYEKLIHNPFDVLNDSLHLNNKRDEKLIYNPTDSPNYNPYEKLIHNPVEISNHSLRSNNNEDKKLIKNLSDSPNYNLNETPIHNPIDDPYYSLNPNKNQNKKLMNNSDDQNYDPIENLFYNSGGNITQNSNNNPHNNLNVYSSSNPKYNLSANPNNNKSSHNLNNSKNESKLIDEDESIESILMRDLV